MYNLKRAQTRLRAAFPGVVQLVMTPRSVGAVVRVCKLFDPEARCWRDFDGRATSAPIPLPPLNAPEPRG
jgi:omega-6 fatty acid desaturase (delta-12 desaturase)